MTPEKIEELKAIDAKVAEAVVACDASYLALREAITAKDAFCATLVV